MTKLFERAVTTVRNLPDEAQDGIARLLLLLAGDEPQAVIPMGAEEEASFDQSFAEAARGEFVSDETLKAFWAKNGLH